MISVSRMSPDDYDKILESEQESKTSSLAESVTSTE